MMFTTLVTTLVTIAALLLLGGLVLLVSPLRVLAQGEFSGQNRSMALRAFFMHPAVINLTCRIEARSFDIVLFGRFTLVHRSGESEEMPLGETPAPEDASVGARVSATAGVADLHEHAVHVQMPQRPSDGERKPAVAAQRPEEPAQSSTPKLGTTPAEGRVGRVRQAARVAARKAGLWHGFALSHRRTVAKAARWLARVLPSLVRVVEFDEISGSVRANLGDVAATGTTFGCVTALLPSPSPGRCGRFGFTFEPVFDGEEFVEATGTVAVSTSLLRVSLPMVTAVVFFPYLAAYALWRDAKKLRVKLEKQSNSARGPREPANRHGS